MKPLKLYRRKTFPNFHIIAWSLHAAVPPESIPPLVSISAPFTFIPTNNNNYQPKTHFPFSLHGDYIFHFIFTFHFLSETFADRQKKGNKNKRKLSKLPLRQLLVVHNSHAYSGRIPILYVCWSVSVRHGDKSWAESIPVFTAPPHYPPISCTRWIELHALSLPQHPFAPTKTKMQTSLYCKSLIVNLGPVTVVGWLHWWQLGWLLLLLVYCLAVAGIVVSAKHDHALDCSCKSTGNTWSANKT